MLDRWPAAVGEAISRNAWPARVGRDGTLHVHTADSVWAFELAQRGAEIAARLGVGAVRFVPGPLPGPGREHAPSRPAPPEPSPSELEAAAAIAASASEPGLREAVARAAGLSLARSAANRSV